MPIRGQRKYVGAAEVADREVRLLCRSDLECWLRCSGGPGCGIWRCARSGIHRYWLSARSTRSPVSCLYFSSNLATSLVVRRGIVVSL